MNRSILTAFALAATLASPAAAQLFGQAEEPLSASAEATAPLEELATTDALDQDTGLTFYEDFEYVSRTWRQVHQEMWLREIRPDLAFSALRCGIYLRRNHREIGRPAVEGFFLVSELKEHASGPGGEVRDPAKLERVLRRLGSPRVRPTAAEDLRRLRWQVEDQRQHLFTLLPVLEKAHDEGVALPADFVAEFQRYLRFTHRLEQAALAKYGEAWGAEDPSLQEWVGRFYPSQRSAVDLPAEDGAAE